MFVVEGYFLQWKFHEPNFILGMFVVEENVFNESSMNQTHV